MEIDDEVLLLDDGHDVGEIFVYDFDRRGIASKGLLCSICRLNNEQCDNSNVSSKSDETNKTFGLNVTKCNETNKKILESIELPILQKKKKAWCCGIKYWFILRDQYFDQFNILRGFTKGGNVEQEYKIGEGDENSGVEANIHEYNIMRCSNIRMFRFKGELVVCKIKINTRQPKVARIDPLRQSRRPPLNNDTKEEAWPRGRNQNRLYKVKADISFFNGVANIEQLLDWLYEVETFFKAPTNSRYGSFSKILTSEFESKLIESNGKKGDKLGCFLLKWRKNVAKCDYIGSDFVKKLERARVNEVILNAVPRKYHYSLKQMLMHSMDLAFAAADIIVSRAGAMTCSEIFAMGKPCILLTSPNVAKGHQFRNASLMADLAGSRVINEDELDSLTLKAQIEEIIAYSNFARSGADNRMIFLFTYC
ncbi:Glycosyl transferase, family 28, C-terminal [Dillenia turbinata]|uniref:Glycosyl transferase, family 28, C-terminal n=1 Tax=Dillenia turbinata TaxID=194707 RepID=A0AAN8Z1M1_9MAGN